MTNWSRKLCHPRTELPPLSRKNSQDRKNLALFFGMLAFSCFRPICESCFVCIPELKNLPQDALFHYEDKKIRQVDPATSREVRPQDGQKNSRIVSLHSPFSLLLGPAALMPSLCLQNPVQDVLFHYDELVQKHVPPNCRIGWCMGNSESSFSIVSLFHPLVCGNQSPQKPSPGHTVSL